VRVQVGDISLSCLVAGSESSRPVVFIHGFPFSKAMWGPQMSALASGYRVVTYDIRGHGESDRGDGHYLIEFFVDDLIGLLDALHIDDPVLVGLSMGGYIVLRAVERSPERFSALVLCDTRSEADSNEGKLKRAAMIRLLKTEGIDAFAEQSIKTLFAPDSFTKNPSAVSFVRDTILATPPETIAATHIALSARTDHTDSLSRITVPTLILVGEHDAVTPPSAALSMKERIQHADVHIISGAGHVSNLENPQEFNRFLKAFLDKLT